MSVATQAIKVVIVVISVGAATKAVRSKKDAPKGGKPAEPVTVAPANPRTGPVSPKPDPIRTGHEHD